MGQTPRQNVYNESTFTIKSGTNGSVLFSWKKRNEGGRKEREESREPEERLAFHPSKQDNNETTPRRQADVLISITILPIAIGSIERLYK